MSAPSTEAPEPDRGRGAERKPSSRARGGLATLRGRRGSTAMVAGGTLLARAVSLLRTNRRRAAAQALLGVALVAVGLRRRRSSSGRARTRSEMPDGATVETRTGADETAGTGTDDTADSEGQSGADEAATERDRSAFAADALDEEASVDAVTDPGDEEGDAADDAT